MIQYSTKQEDIDKINRNGTLSMSIDNVVIYGSRAKGNFKIQVLH
jgi:hypothetical protein